MRNDEVVTVRRLEYLPPSHRVERVRLEFDLDPVRTVVTARLEVVRTDAHAGTFALDGEDLELLDVSVADHPDARVRHDRQRLLVDCAADRYTLHTRVAIAPSANSELMGLYTSQGSFFTQCEPEGFRRITFFPDRPDVMAVYDVVLRADPQRYPVLLANGNLVAQGTADDGRHWAHWQDPFPKPSYLFALVAGRFECREGRLVTRSGREVLLQVWVDPGHVEQAAHAYDSLVRAIRWDEERYGLELDLDRFMIVASHDFNMGAMENKGLNIFNAKYVLASPRLATDLDYDRIESIVGHEYFHNWTGNRVTCRDWFQLSLKEGLTVYRDQEFSADLAPDASARAVRRIETVRALRATQFPEDAGPMAHPVRPDSYEEIGNFYTPTVYEKGAEVVRMLEALLGREGFRRGLELYFRRHDGQAVTCDDFVDAMADANGRDLSQFARWYEQAGTPHVRASGHYDAETRSYALTLAQRTPDTPGQSNKPPLLIPFAVGLLGPDGADLPLQLDDETSRHGAPGATTRVLELAQREQTFRFVEVPAEPVPSLARGFSAPLIVEADLSDAQLAFLATHDADPFNRWEAIQRLATARLLAAVDAIGDGVAPQAAVAPHDTLAEVFERTLCDGSLSPHFRAVALQLPGEGFLADQVAVVDPAAISAARHALKRALGARLAPHWLRAYADCATPGPYQPDAAAVGRRALRHLALAYLVETGEAAALQLARRQLETAGHLSDFLGALVPLLGSRADYKADVLVHCARHWAGEPLLMNKWFALQAMAPSAPGEPPTIDRVRALLAHPAFTLSNPNKVYALVLGFCAHNAAEFHRADGSGYAFWRDMVLALDSINPSVAARIARTLERWRKYTPDRRDRMQAALRAVAAAQPLSRDVHEIVHKALAPVS